jgi:uncharacterized protein
VGIALTSLAVFSFIPLLLAKPLFGLDALNTSQLFTQTTNPQVINLLKFMQLMQSLGLFVVPPLLFAWIYTRNIGKYLLLNFNFKSITALTMIVLMLSALPAINWLGMMNESMQLPAALQGLESWMKNMEKEAEQLTTSFLVMNSVSVLLVNLFIIAFIPAIGEELLFRGALQKIFIEWTKNKHAGIWISAIVFSAMHLQFYGFVPRMLLGAMLGYVFNWTGSLWIPILGHFVNNATAILISYLEQRGKVSSDVETIGASSDYAILVVISFVLVGALLFVLKKNSKSSEELSIQ